MAEELAEHVTNVVKSEALADRSHGCGCAAR